MDPVGLGVLEIDGEAVQSGSTQAILGHPMRALEAAARLAAGAGIALEPGGTVLAGAATAAAPLHPGHQVKAGIAGLGTVGFTVPLWADARSA
ncbi:fumarylacetoacetate hydrolase family protein [Peterkaempfera griseoplana]|uniref:fumarylacetoacetate hydrolase family protein n=1 Tax=Peterkaempfera griseoplana TaxID=66896 RepID=UPI0006E1E87B|nr:fumarylacetoacetate hydrolase family protein [Peterkaempfera griseoplana]